jgi:hypothetical protein
MREQRHVHVAEQSGANQVRLGADQFFGDAGHSFSVPGRFLALHDFLHGKRGGDVQRHAGVVSLAVPGRAVDKRSR